MRSSGRIDWNTAGGFAAVVLWSTTVALARSLSEQVGPLAAGAGVYLIAGLFCLPRLVHRRTLVRQGPCLSRRYVFGCGFLFVLYTVLLFLAVGSVRDRQQVLEIGLINYLWPAATVLFSLLLLGQQANLLLAPGTVLALAGEFLVITQGDRVSWGAFAGHVRVSPVPYALALIAAVAWALYSTLTRRWSRPQAGGAVELFIPASGLTLLALSLLSPGPSVWTVRAAGEAAALGVCTVLAYGLWDAAMRKGRLLLVVVFSYFTPLLSTLVSSVYLAVTPSLRLWAGCLLLVTGSLVTWRSVRDRG